MLRGISTTAIIKTQNRKGFVENQKVVRRGGAVSEGQGETWKQRQERR